MRSLPIRSNFISSFISVGFFLNYILAKTVHIQLGPYEECTEISFCNFASVYYHSGF